MRNFFAPAALALALALAGSLAAQDAARLSDADQTRAALRTAEAEARAAGRRGDRLEAEARKATEAAEKTGQEAAALAARIQQAEAGIGAAEARIDLIDGQRGRLNRRLAERREPLVRLTGALQKLARRPLALSALKPGSLRETVYLRAMLDSTIPQVRARTSALRKEIERGRQLEREARQALTALQDSENQLETRRQRLAAIETRQRLVSRAASGNAAREAERALALAEEARDLDNLVERLDKAGSLREELAALPGPILRPSRPQASEVMAAPAATQSVAARPPGMFQLPVAGRTVSGFGSISSGGVRNNGLSLVPREGAQVVAPGAGRVVFAGPYRGYERIVILEHDGGWTSLVTGLARIDVDVGEALVAGAPLGIAGIDDPLVTIELRREGQLVNPLDYVN